jgi:glycosyltransferase involved in cell wall biosynthesis
MWLVTDQRPSCDALGWKQSLPKVHEVEIGFRPAREQIALRSRATVHGNVPNEAASNWHSRNLAGPFRLKLQQCSFTITSIERDSQMKIAQISPLVESVPPRLYGGTERVVSYLTEELVAQGHDVTLFASGDSITSANLVPCTNRALRLDAKGHDPIPYYMVMLDKIMQQSAEFDVLHFHIDHLHFPLIRQLDNAVVTTLHGRQDLPVSAPFYAHFCDLPIISISHAQRGPIAGANFVGTVYHGMPVDLYCPTSAPREGYLAFLGRISPEKDPIEAIHIAHALGMPLKIAAKVDKVDVEYFQEKVEPLLDTPGVEFLGEVGEKEKGDFLRGASALLFPICWPEPFGLVMIEAMACGTPILAYDFGSVREVIDDGVTGYVVRSLDEAVATLPKVLQLDRGEVRRRFEKRFSVSRMAEDYVRIYQMLVRRSRTQPSLRPVVNDVTRVNGDTYLSDASLHVD